MVPEAIADAARRRSEEAVQRLREESRRRIAGRRPGMSHCMLGTMLSMLLFVALQSRRIYWAEAASTAAQVAAQQDAARAEREHAAQRERDHREACAKLGVEAARVRVLTASRLVGANGQKQRALIGAELSSRLATMARDAADRGCPAVSIEPRRPRAREAKVIPHDWVL